MKPGFRTEIPDEVPSVFRSAFVGIWTEILAGVRYS
jgi:hypothetical protein